MNVFRKDYSMLFGFLILAIIFATGSLYTEAMSMNGTMTMNGNTSMNQPMPNMSKSMPNMAMSQTMFTVNGSSKSFQVMFSSNSVLPRTVAFNQDQKMLSFQCQNLLTNDLSHIEITLSKNMLGGNYSVALGGKEIKYVEEDFVTTDQATLHLNIPKSFIESNSIGDSNTLAITGTQVIPEFPVVMWVLVASVTVILIVASRKLNRIIFFSR